ncbi:PREDICTED: bromodomain-containing protein DDB_G0270170-like isoform X2 [Populus euphratica]|uniref:Bromodomain-containing protein DDB_G0270170-like isoform X2 n=1 Tax=Populus euphratica TaxID=75702 RepID=A0AAJ6T8R4_POPEU|nr:PREDICTED: bromodomain-containing protein DDB_G0270170-like isoform X2 [Populus euphratica]
MKSGRMLREGHRRSPRISALDLWKAQPPRRTTVAKKTRLTRSITSTSTSTAAEVQDKELDQQKENQTEGPACTTRAKKKRKLKPPQDVVSTPNSQQEPKLSDVSDDREISYEDHPISSDEPILQNKDSPKQKGQADSPDQPSSLPCTSWVPEKRMLEHIIDILQRRDTHEIFAEPVDPNEVEEYYEIIKEPMDFGTMRAKLHEGMYKSIEQFEHDVFLISENAMHFNSSSTIYFRQARAIDELAKKVFHLLRTDPENFELEFLGTRRRNGRRPQHEAKGSNYSSSPKVARSSKSSNTAVHVSPNPTPCLTSCSSSLKRAIRLNSGCLGITTHSEATDDRGFFGSGDSKRSSDETDRRSTYKPWMSFLNENYPIASSIYSNSKPLVHVNQQDTSYSESLLLFAKDLGPTAQMVARRKLNGWLNTAANFSTSGSNFWLQAPNCQNFAASASAQYPPTFDVPPSAACQNISRGERVDMFGADKGGRAYAVNKLSLHGTSSEVAPNHNCYSILGDIKSEVSFANEMDVANVSKNEKPHQSQNRGLQQGSHSYVTDARDLNLLTADLSINDDDSAMWKVGKSKMDNKPQSLDLGFKDSQSNALESRFSESYSFSPSSWPLKTTGMSSFNRNMGNTRSGSTRILSTQCRGGDQAFSTQGPSHGLGGSSERIPTLKPSEQPTHVSGHFIFDLPFLKTRLDQINSLGQNRFSQHGSGMQGPFPNRTGETYNDGRPHSSLNSQPANLALQL